MTQKMFSLELQLHHQVRREIVLTADVLHERLTTFVGCDEIGGDGL
ncbi:MAG: hypothetical protein MJ202_07765 [Lentisphaeria bacterium]|nr:hypothetical protein [Lentisphaeria bacterium]